MHIFFRTDEIYVWCHHRVFVIFSFFFCFYREHAKNGCYTITIINDMLAPSLKREQIFIFRCCCCSCCSKENAAQHKQIESSSKRTIFNPSMIHRNFLKVDQLYKIAAGGLVNPLIAYGIK